MTRLTTQTVHHKDLSKEPYARILIPEDDGTYSADLLEFPGCHAIGRTPDEAIANLERAAASWVAAALEQGQAIPPPMAVSGHSGKINLRLPRSIHKQAARFAARDDVSLNQFFSGAISARVGAEEFYEYLVQRLESKMPNVSIVNVQYNSSSVMVAMEPRRLDVLPAECVLQDLPPITVETKKVSADE